MLLVTKIFVHQSIKLDYKLNRLREKKLKLQKKLNDKSNLFLKFYNLYKKKLEQ